MRHSCLLSLLLCTCSAALFAAGCRAPRHESHARDWTLTLLERDALGRLARVTRVLPSGAIERGEGGGAPALVAWLDAEEVRSLADEAQGVLASSLSGDVLEGGATIEVSLLNAQVLRGRVVRRDDDSVRGLLETIERSKDVRAGVQ